MSGLWIILVYWITPTKSTEEANINCIENIETKNYDLNAEINQDITIDEIKKCIKKLKNNKAAGVDLILNEFLKNIPHELLDLMTIFFNKILALGHVPVEWTLGLIKPLYKGKGPRDNSDNYRGITLLSCIGKLFTSILNDRITKFLEENELLGEEQAGFRSGYSTIDHIFVLHTLISIYQGQKRKVYCAFVDYKKAFDLIDRSSLWSKLLAHRINGKVFQVIKNMYENAKSCVALGNDQSEYFTCNIGVRQGENLSPILFALYLNDFQDFLSKNYAGLPGITNKLKDDPLNLYVKLFSLLYADDTIILAETPEELQKGLNALNEYCKKWSLTVNTEKTKVVIFSRGKVRKIPKFTYNSSEIEVVDEYNYLGCKFNFNNKFTKAKNNLINHARRALFSLNHKSYDLDLPVDIQCELFDQMIVPILLYGCEIWGFENNSALENFHMKFCKKTLGVHKYTPNCIVLCELGRHKIAQTIDNRMFNYWVKINCEKSSKLTNVLYQLLRNLHEQNIIQSPWLNKIKSILNNSGMNYLWDLDPSYLNKIWLKGTMKIRQSDIGCQELNSEIANSSQCTIYKHIAPQRQMATYLKQLDKTTRLPITKIRCLNNKLPIITGRYQNVNRNERYCTLCLVEEVKVLGDEYHFIMECPHFCQSRKAFLSSNYYKRPNMEKLVELFNSNDLITQTKLSKFCKAIVEKFSPDR